MKLHHEITYPETKNVIPELPVPHCTFEWNYWIGKRKKNPLASRKIGTYLIRERILDHHKILRYVVRQEENGENIVKERIHKLIILSNKTDFCATKGTDKLLSIFKNSKNIVPMTIIWDIYEEIIYRHQNDYRDMDIRTGGEHWAYS